jgi:hypothetical protein
MHDFCFRNRSYLGEFEAEFKKALARESGAQGVLFDEKTEGRKSRDTVPLIPSVLLVRHTLVWFNLYQSFCPVDPV